MGNEIIISEDDGKIRDCVSHLGTYNSSDLQCRNESSRQCGICGICDEEGSETERVEVVEDLRALYTTLLAVVTVLSLFGSVGLRLRARRSGSRAPRSFASSSTGEGLQVAIPYILL